MLKRTSTIASRSGFRAIRDRVLLHLLYGGGLRVGEVCNLRWRNLRPHGEAGQITVYGKGGRTRSIALPAVAKRAGSRPRAGSRNCSPSGRAGWHCQPGESPLVATRSRQPRPRPRCTYPPCSSYPRTSLGCYDQRLPSRPPGRLQCPVSRATEALCCADEARVGEEGYNGKEGLPEARQTPLIRARCAMY